MGTRAAARVLAVPVYSLARADEGTAATWAVAVCGAPPGAGEPMGFGRLRVIDVCLTEGPGNDWTFSGCLWSDQPGPVAGDRVVVTVSSKLRPKSMVDPENWTTG